MDVVLVRWPDDGDRRELLALEGVPRLLLLRDGVEPPAASDCLEDWIRVPADEHEVRCRVDALHRRSQRHQNDRPLLDEHGVLRYGGRWVSLPPVEARLTTAMLDRFGSVVSREALTRAGWPTGTGGRNALDVHVLRLRRRLDGVGLAIRTVRARGYLLEAAVGQRELLPS
jgi:DNA-binding response OmpR family regulator